MKPIKKSRIIDKIKIMSTREYLSQSGEAEAPSDSVRQAASGGRLAGHRGAGKRGAGAGA